MGQPPQRHCSGQGDPGFIRDKKPTLMALQAKANAWEQALW